MDGLQNYQAGDRSLAERVRTRLRQVDTWMAGRQPAFYVALGVLVLLLLGAADYLTGQELASTIFYLFPITIGAWYSGRRSGILLAVASAVTWSAADLAAGHIYSHPGIVLWNGGVALIFFLLHVLLLTALKHRLAIERHLATHDALTGILNRRAFGLAAERTLELARRFGHPFTVLFIDLDEFKQINDSLGHSEGDRVLQAVADALRQRARRTDAVARLGGDEFALLLPETGYAGAKELVLSMYRHVATSMARHDWPVHCSIGAASFERPPRSLDEVLQLADSLMYAVKQQGKNGIVHRAWPESS
jgi:diguanylate cyclase (GGDEF)-like protein